MSHELHQMLLQVKREGASICEQLKRMTPAEGRAAFTREMRQLFAKWPENKAQDLVFPVEASLLRFKKASDDDKLWADPRRHALLDWLIEETKP